MSWKVVKTYAELWEYSKDSWIAVCTFTNEKTIIDVNVYKPGHPVFKNRIGYSIGAKTSVLKIDAPEYRDQE